MKVIIGLGNTGTNIVRAIELNNKFEKKDVRLFTIDSLVNNEDDKMFKNITSIPIFTNQKSGSGRDRFQGGEMFLKHDKHDKFTEIYTAAIDAASVEDPVIVITSSSGGTGSGATPALCSKLREYNDHIIPIIVCPNEADPAAYHYNTNDLFTELGDVGVATYATFINAANDVSYDTINAEIVEFINIIIGNCFGVTRKDSIDDNDMASVLRMPGRFIAVSARGPIERISRSLAFKLASGFQPFNIDTDVKGAICTAYSVKSSTADTDFGVIFNDVREMLKKKAVFDEFKNIVIDDNDGVVDATIIISGLERNKLKELEDVEFKEASGISAGLQSSKRPAFMTRNRKSSSLAIHGSNRVGSLSIDTDKINNNK